MVGVLPPTEIKLIHIHHYSPKSLYVWAFTPFFSLCTIPSIYQGKHILYITHQAYQRNHPGESLCTVDFAGEDSTLRRQGKKPLLFDDRREEFRGFPCRVGCGTPKNRVRFFWHFSSKEKCKKKTLYLSQVSYPTIPYHPKKKPAATQSEMVILIIGDSRRAGVGYDLDNFRLSKNWKTTINCDRSNLQYADGRGKYRYGFNGQERENELNPSITSAEYWMYDGRLGRRWNVDPVYKHHLSNYSVLGNNPILMIDPKGDDDFYSSRGQLLKRTKEGDKVYLFNNSLYAYYFREFLSLSASKDVREKLLENYLRSNSTSIDKVQIDDEEKKFAVSTILVSIIEESKLSKSHIKVGIQKTDGDYAALSTGDNLRFGTEKDNKKLNHLLRTKSNILCAGVHELEHMQGGASYSLLFGNYSESRKIEAKQELKAFYAEVDSKWWKGTTDDYKKDVINNVVKFLNRADSDVANENTIKFNNRIEGGQFKKGENGKYKFE